MADKMMRIAGRGKDGTAKAVQTTDNGVLVTESPILQLINENYAGHGRLILPNETWTSDVFNVGALKTIVVNALCEQVVYPYEITIEEVFGSANTSIKKHVFSELQSTSRIEANITANAIRVHVKNTWTANIRVALNVVATNAMDAKTNDFKTLFYEILSDNGREITAGSKWESPVFNRGEYNAIAYSTQLNKATRHKIEVIELGGIRTPYAVKTNVVQAQVNVNTTGIIPIQSPNFKIVITNLATEAFKVNLQAHLFNASEDFSALKTIAKEETLLKVENEIKNVAKDTTLERLISEVRALQTQAANEEPPHMRNVRIITDPIVTRVHWFHDGLFYGSSWRTIYTSPDAKNWTKLVDVLDAAPYGIVNVIVSDTNRLVVSFGDGGVYVSDENHVFDKTAPTFKTGSFDARFGSSKHKNVITLNTYMLPQGLNDGQIHEAWASFDNGETWKKVFDNSKFDASTFNENGRVHLHDMEYDPYSGRLYLYNGDFGDRGLQYSDDWGTTWQLAFPRGTTDNCTQLIATKDGLIFGADSDQGGVAFLRIDRSKRVNPTLSLDNYDGDFWVFDDVGKRYIACRRWVDRDNGIYILPFIVETDANAERSAYLAYSKDGYKWHIIFKSPHKGHYTGWHKVCYGNGLLVGMYQDDPQTNALKIFIGEIDL